VDPWWFREVNQTMQTPESPVQKAKWEWILLLLVLVCSCAGCCTPAIWRQTAAKDWRPLDERPEVWAKPDGTDALVAFTQMNAASKAPAERRVAGWLSTWPELSAVGKTEVQNLTESAPSLIRLSVLELDELGKGSPLDPDHHAVWDGGNCVLTIKSGANVMGPVQLPAAHEERRTTARILLTPLGIVGDAAITAGALTAIGLSSGMAGPM
jgi:hypothetical protein